MTNELRARVRRDLSVVVGTRVVLRSEDTVRCFPVNAGGRVLRQALDVQVMNTLLGEADRAFLASSGSHVDLLVEHARTGRPLMALELDGPQHQESPQLKRDMRKDRILRVAGLPLLRLCEAQPPSAGLTRTLLRWRLQTALANPDFLRACLPALREALQDGLKQQNGPPGQGDSFLAT